MKRTPPALLAALLTALLGCGAKSSLDRPEPRGDGGQREDGGLDAGVDAGPPDGGTLVVDCGRSPAYTSPRRPVTLEAASSGPDPLVSESWELVASPPGSTPLLSASPDPRVIVVTPDVEGSVLMRFTALDAGGRRASCDVDVQAIVGPPVAICPEEELYTSVGTPIVLEGDGFDDEAIVAWRWELLSSPPGAMPTLRGADGPLAELVSFARGPHVLRLTVVDADMATGSCEITVLVTGPPEVSCGEATISAPTRRPVTLRARATDDVGVASRRWEVLERPPMSTASPAPPNAEVTTLTPDRRGRYRLRFTATDVEGASASCEITVNATPTPPEVSCPAVIEGRPLTPVDIAASAVDDGVIVRWAWRVDTRPPGSGASPPAPLDRPMTRFTPDIAGVYSLTVTATDDDGMTGTCTTRVNAGNVDGLRVEMFWDTPTGDMDLHLLSPTATRWTSDGDCYYANCNVSNGHNLEWGGPGTDDNPRLDIDDLTGFGPENINIATPVPGTYRIGVHAYSGGAAHRITVRIYCGGSTTEPRRTFGPVTLRDRGGPSSNDFWRVADVTITGTGCTIADLSRPSGPWITRHDSAIGMR